MSETRKADMAEAKAAWEAHPKPSVRAVSEAMLAAGLDCPVSTLQRWKKAGWVANEDPRRRTKKGLDPQTAEQASAAIAEAVRKEGGKGETRGEQLAKEETAMKARAAELDKIESDAELARQTMRKSLIAQIVLSEQIIRRAAFLVEVVPEIAAKMIDVLKGPASSTTIVMPPSEKAHNGEDAKVVNGRELPQPSATTLAIEAFKNRQRAGAAL